MIFGNKSIKLSTTQKYLSLARPGKRFLLFEYLVSYLLPFLYLGTFGLLSRSWYVGNINLAILVSSAIFAIVFFLPPIRTFKVSISSNLLGVLILISSGIVIIISFTLSNDYRYSGSGTFTQKLLLDTFKPTLLLSTLLLFRTEFLNLKRKAIYFIPPVFALALSLSGISSALTLLGLIGLALAQFFSHRKLFIALPLLFLVLLLTGNYIKEGSTPLETIGLITPSHFIQRNSSHFTTLSRKVTPSQNLHQCGNGFDTFTSSMKYRFKKILGYEHNPPPDYVSIAHLNRSQAFGKIMDRSHGMSPGIIASGFFLSCTFGPFLSLFFLSLTYILIHNFLRTTNIKSWIDIAFLWLILRGLFYNPVDALMIIDSSFILFLLVLFFAHMRVRP